MKSKNFFYLILLILSCVRVQAKTNDLLWRESQKFSTIGINEGLPHNFVEDILKDSKGFLWFALYGGGVCRYDSYQFISFNSTESVRHIQNDFAKAICEDLHDRLWIAGDNGLECLDTEKLISLTLSASPALAWDSLRSQPCHSIYCDRKGNLWVGGRQATYRINFTSDGNIATIQNFPFIHNKDIITFYENEKDILWIGCSENIYRIDLRHPTSSVSLFANLPRNCRTQALYQTGNHFWVGTSNGLFLYDSKGNHHKEYHSSAPFHSLSQDYITDIAETPNQTLIVSTLKGLNIYNEQTDKFEQVGYESFQDEKSDFIFCNFINCLLVDGETVWIGTEADGLMKAVPKRLTVTNYIHSGDLPQSISPQTVNAIYTADDGEVWVGTVESGLNRMTSPGQFTHYTMKDGLPSHTVSCITGYGSQLWVGMWGGGVCSVEQTLSGKVKFHPLYDNTHPELAWASTCAIQYDSLNQTLWIATSKSVYTYHVPSEKIDEPFRNQKLGGMQTGNAGACIDRQHNLWLGLTAGLCRIDLKRFHQGKNVFQLWPYQLNNPQSHDKERITFVTISSDNRILVGTNGNGFYIGTQTIDGTYTFQNYSTRDGLVNNHVRGILEDNTKNIWISTLHGLSCFFPQKQCFQNYTLDDGLACNQFYWNAAYKGRNGELYFGNMTGLSVVSPASQPSILQKKFPVVFTHCQTLQGEVQVKDGVVEIHEREKFVSIEFATLDYNVTPQAAYAYRLKGFNDQWTITGKDNRTISYANLPPGQYVLEVRYATDGIHFESGSEGKMALHITPYFFRTAWFRIIGCLCLILILYLIYMWRVRTLKLQKKELHQKVVSRTQKLKTQTDLLAQRTQTLEKQNELLSRQKAEILDMSKRIQNLTAEKLAFFTNITHEFRTPLTLIIGPVRHLLETNTDIETNKQLQIVDRNSHYLLSLVNQLLDFRKVESGNMKITLHEGYLLPLFQNLKLLFSAYAAEKGLRIQYYFHLPECTVSFDKDALHKILFNLVSNAIKFTPKGGCIKLFTKTLTSTSGSLLFVSVCDTGPGVAEKDKEMIFQRFYQSDKRPCTSINGQSGTGIGLYLCRQLVQLQGGQIWVVNNRTAGCSFRFLLPLHLIEASPSTRVQISLPKSPETHKKMMETEKSSINLLIVEDNKDMREYLHAILSPYYHCLEASQGKEALDILHTQHVDFILSDLMMPIMDGMELSHHVKSDFSISHIPFLILTAKTSETAHIQSFEFGVDAYLTKPFDEHLLLTRIENLLRNRKRLQEKFAYHMISEELHIKPGTQDQAFMDKLLDLLKKNYSNAEYGVDEFSVDMGISRSLLYKKTQELTGTAIGELLRNYRLNIAKEILISKTGHTLNISEIAYQVGFNDPKYFTRCFTKHFNVPPSKFTGK